MSALCIIPARGSSKRFVRKNLAMLGGHPLVGLAVRVARASRVFDTICVSSEDEEILRVAEQYGADVALRRSDALAKDDVQVKDVCRAVLETLPAPSGGYATFAVLLPTSPLRTAADIQAAHKLLDESGADCCMSVTAFEHPPQRAVSIREGVVKAYFGGEFMKPAQALEPLYRHDGCVIVAKSQPFLQDPNFYRDRVVPYVVPRERAIDVDHPADLAWAEFLLGSGAATLDTP